MIQLGECARRVLLACVLVVGLLVLRSSAARAQGECVGDCDGGGAVLINELIVGVNIALGRQDVSVCPSFDCQSTGTVQINCLIQGVNNAFHGCRRGTPSSTPTANSAASATPTPELSVSATPTGELSVTATRTGEQSVT